MIDFPHHPLLLLSPEVGEMVLDVICQLMSVVALRDTDNSTSFLLHLCASCLMYMPNEQAHNKIVRKLCEYILPMAICKCVYHKRTHVL